MDVLSWEHRNNNTTALIIKYGCIVMETQKQQKQLSIFFIIIFNIQVIYIADLIRSFVSIYVIGNMRLLDFYFFFIRFIVIDLVIIVR